MQKLLTVPVLFTTAFILAGCTPAANNGTSTTTSQATTYTAAQVAEHDSSSDCWMIISGKVYNVTSYIPQHPGGNEILNGCGKDATQMFATQNGRGDGHSNLATQTMAKYYVGDLKN